MIQRIQSVLLLLAALVNVGTLFVPVWKFPGGTTNEVISGMGVMAQTSATETQSLSFTENIPHVILVALIAMTAAFLLFVIFQYKNRVSQMKMAYAGVFMLLIEIMAMVLLTRQGPFLISDTGMESIVQFGFGFPVVAAILAWFAAIRIKKDEELVRSVDRIR